jgi:hypothetical protein
MIRTHTFRGKKWKIIPAESQAGGICESPCSLDKEMVIPVEGTTRFDLDTVIHESLHASLWLLSEETVEETATDIARLLWRLGWRNEGETQ